MHALHMRQIMMTFCLVVTLGVSAWGFDFSQLEESVTEHTLDNGLKILIMERHDAPVTSFVTFCNEFGNLVKVSDVLIFYLVYCLI